MQQKVCSVVCEAAASSPPDPTHWSRFADDPIEDAWRVFTQQTPAGVLPRSARHEHPESLDGVTALPMQAATLLHPPDMHAQRLRFE